MFDDEFQATVGGSLTYPAQCGSLKKGDHIVINDQPCKIIELTTSKTGKHGHAKASITAINIFNGKKLEDSLPTSHNVDCPNVKRSVYEFVSIDDNNYVTFIDEKGELREDLTANDELAAPLKDAQDSGKNILLTVLSALETEQIMSIREDRTN